jgi:hypothetical protein
MNAIGRQKCNDIVRDPDFCCRLIWALPPLCIAGPSKLYPGKEEAHIVVNGGRGRAWVRIIRQLPNGGPLHFLLLQDRPEGESPPYVAWSVPLDPYFLGLLDLDQDPFVRGMDPAPDPDPSIIKKK